MQPAYLYLIDKPIAWLLASLPWFVIGILDIGFFDSRLSLKQMAAILTALAISWLGERLTSYHLIGGGMTLMGVLLAQLLVRPVTVRRRARLAVAGCQEK